MGSTVHLNKSTKELSDAHEVPGNRIVTSENDLALPLCLPPANELCCILWRKKSKDSCFCFTCHHPREVRELKSVLMVVEFAKANPQER